MSLAFAACGFGQNIFTGKVLDVQSSKPVPFARIDLPELDLVLITDSAGIFRLENSPAGSFRILVSSNGYEEGFLTHNFSDSMLVVFLKPAHILLDKVIVSADNGMLQRESISNVESVRLSELNSISSATLGESLSNIPGVYQLATGPGISKPVLRGLSGPRVVTYLNGMRVENQQWGEDHGMGVTDLGVGGVEILKGPSSLLYGSDAMGGVIHFTDESYASPGTALGYFQTRFDAVTMGSTNRLALKFNVKAIKVNVFAGGSSHADFRLPSGKFAGNSRSLEHSEKLSIGYNRRNWVLNIRYNSSRQLVGIPGHSEDSIVNPAQFQPDSSGRKMIADFQDISNQYFSFENKFLLRRTQISLLVANTNNRLQEFEEDLSIAAMDMRLNNTLYNFKWLVKLTDQIDFVFGSQGMYARNINAPGAEELLIPNSNTADVGVYSLLTAQVRKWKFQAGGRFDHRQLMTFVTDSGFAHLDRKFDSFNFSAGSCRVTKISSLRLNVSSGFRAPNSAELFADGAHHGALRYELGDVSLQTERAIQIDFSLGIHGEHFEFIINPFLNVIDDFISLQKTDSLVENLPVYQFQQENRVLLGGTDAGVHYHPHFAHWLHFESSFSLVLGEESSGADLPLMPPARINNQLKFEFKTKGKFKFQQIVIQYVHLFAQNRVSDYETVTAGYDLVNLALNMQWELKTPIEINIGAKNALNANYYDHLSRLKNVQIPNMGWNCYVSLKLNFRSDKASARKTVE